MSEKSTRDLAFELFGRPPRIDPLFEAVIGCIQAIKKCGNNIDMRLHKGRIIDLVMSNRDILGMPIAQPETFERGLKLIFDAMFVGKDTKQVEQNNMALDRDADQCFERVDTTLKAADGDQAWVCDTTHH